MGRELKRRPFVSGLNLDSSTFVARLVFRGTRLFCGIGNLQETSMLGGNHTRTQHERAPPASMDHLKLRDPLAARLELTQGDLQMLTFCP